MDKKGQVTLFVVLGMVIISIFILVYALENGAINKSGILKAVRILDDESAIRHSAEECMKSVGENALLVVGLQGGKILPDRYYTTNGVKVAYGYYEGKNILASREIVEHEIEKYYDYFLPSCIDDIKSYSIEKGNLSTDANIKDESVAISIKYPLSYIKKNSRIKINPTYAKEFKVKLGKMLAIANSLAEKTISKENELDMNYIYGIGSEFYISILPNEEGRIYVLVDKETVLKDSNYTFIFAEKFSEKGLIQ